jgi:CRP/FNR family transcriptional regulator, cyclic AMP receptor protein
MIGTTRLRVSFLLNKFRKLGLIGYNAGVEIRSSFLNVCEAAPNVDLYKIDHC